MVKNKPIPKPKQKPNTTASVVSLDSKTSYTPISTSQTSKEDRNNPFGLKPKESKPVKKKPMKVD